jgi:hypothetical protein
MMRGMSNSPVGHRAASLTGIVACPVDEQPGTFESRVARLGEVSLDQACMAQQ